MSALTCVTFNQDELSKFAAGGFMLENKIQS